MITASLSFIKPLQKYEDEKPYFLNIPMEYQSSATLQTNLEFSQQGPVPIVNIRDRGIDAFSLEKDGFEVLQYQPTTLVEPGGPLNVDYCDEICKLISRKCNASYVICYDFRLRENSRSVVSYENTLDKSRGTAAPPVFPVHIDHTVEGGPNRIRRHLTTKEAETYLDDQYRVRIVNVWRPLLHPVEDCPLAICDPSTVDVMDLVAADRVTPDFATEVYYVRHNPKQQWFWVEDQTPNELWAFVNYDSTCKLDGLHWMSCPHAAFANPHARKECLLRKSVEVRYIVFDRPE